MKKKNPPKKPEPVIFVHETIDEKVCPDCHGTGYDPLDGGQCERCAGTGMVDKNG